MPPGINDRYLHFQDAVARLKFIKEKYKLNEILREAKKRSDIIYILEHAFEKAVLSFIDIANRIIAEKSWQKPRCYKDTITVLIQHNLINKSDEEIFKDFVDERNIVTHEYAVIDYAKLYSLLDHLDKITKCLENILSVDTTEI